jgi:Peptidase M66
VRVLTAVWIGCLVALGACSSDPAQSGDDVVGDDAGGVTPDATIVREPLLADGVHIRDVALFQSIKQPLVTGGVAATPAVPPLAGRAGALRIYVDALPAPRQVTAELVVGGRTFTAAGQLSAASTDGAAASVLSIAVPADAFTLGARWSVRLLADDGVPLEAGVANDARWPRDGSDADLGVAPPTKLALMLVPIRYDTDGSGRLPDTGAAQLAVYRDLLTAVYPLSEVSFEVHAPVPWSQALTVTGSVAFGNINDVLIDLRAAEHAAPNVYYYALVAPAVNFGTYCGSGCVSGQSYVVTSATTPTKRVGAGLGFTGEKSAWTMVHEVAHIHGRSHAPCGVTQWDTGYPYANGVTGVWGYDARKALFMAPTAHDFMGYCDSTWTSDYTYRALYERMRALEALTP